MCRRALQGYSYGSLAASLHPVRPPSLFSPSNLAHNPHVSPNLRIRHILLSYPVGVLWFLSFFHTRTYEEKLRELVTSPGADVLVLFGEKDQFTKKEKYRAWMETLNATFAFRSNSNSTTSTPNSTSKSTSTSGTLSAQSQSSPTSSLLSPTTKYASTPASNTPPTSTSSIPAPKLKIEIIPEADHFWRSTKAVMRAARGTVEDWLDEVHQTQQSSSLASPPP